MLPFSSHQENNIVAFILRRPLSSSSSSVPRLPTVYLPLRGRPGPPRGEPPRLRPQVVEVVLEEVGVVASAVASASAASSSSAAAAAAAVAVDEVDDRVVDDDVAGLRVEAEPAVADRVSPLVAEEAGEAGEAGTLPRVHAVALEKKSDNGSRQIS